MRTGKVLRGKRGLNKAGVGTGVYEGDRVSTSDTDSYDGTLVMRGGRVDRC